MQEDPVPAYSDDDPLLRGVRRICLALPHAEEVWRWERAVFRVEEDTFATFGGDSDFPFAVAFMPNPAKIDSFLDNEAFVVANQFSAHPWLGLDLANGTVDWSQVEALVKYSYDKASDC